MERLSRVRAGMILTIFCLILGLYSLKLYSMQVNQPGGPVNNMKTFTTYVTVRAARGELLDRNGNVIVTNRASYDMLFNHYVICSAAGRNQILLELVELCREMDINYVDHFPVTQDAPFAYTLSNYNSAWQGYFQSYLR